VQRGDVIVFEFPGGRDQVIPEEFQFYLKRAIGLAGDTVQIVNRVVLVNGTPAPLPRNMRFDGYHTQPPGLADPRIFPPGAPFNEDNWGPVVIPKKGDAIPLTTANIDRWRVFIAREGHTLRMDERGRVLIDGTPVTAYHVEHNYLFGMGDHRDNSLDGRFWGFIPEVNIVGTPMIVYWSWDPEISIANIFSKLGSVRLGRVGTIIK
jgi:signal peptidase I